MANVKSNIQTSKCKITLQEQKPNLMTIRLVFLSNLKFWLLDPPLHSLGNLDSKELLFFEIYIYQYLAS